MKKTARPAVDLRPPPVVYHGTDCDFDQFDLDGSFGAHFGTQAAARQRLRHTGKLRVRYQPYQAGAGRWMVREQNCSGRAHFEHGPFVSRRAAEAFVLTAPVERAPLAFEIDVYRPLLLPDLGTWEFQTVFHAMAGQINADLVWDAWNRSSQEGWDALKRQIEELGCDCVAYRNETEDRGSMSWIVLRPERIHHVWRYYPPEQQHWAWARAQARRMRGQASAGTEAGWQGEGGDYDADAQDQWQPSSRERMRA